MTLLNKEHAPWSTSKRDLAAKCGYAFKLRYIDKLRVTKGTHAVVGVAAHRLQELILLGDAPSDALEKTLLEAPDLTEKEIQTVSAFLPNCEDFRTRMKLFCDKHEIVETYYEQAWAIDFDFNPVEWNHPNCMFRGVVDYALLTATRHLIVIDHKSGRVHPVDKYGRQLDAYAVLGLSVLPDIKGCQAALHYIATKDIVWNHMRSEKVIRGLLRNALKEDLAARLASLDGYEPRLNKFCKWCDFLEHCPTGTEAVASEKEKKRVETNARARQRRLEKKLAK